MTEKGVGVEIKFFDSQAILRGDITRGKTVEWFVDKVSIRSTTLADSVRRQNATILF